MTKIKFWDKFGNLTVISNPIIEGHNTMFKCMCICGHIKMERSHRLISHTDKSCKHCMDNMKDPWFYGLDDLYRRYIKSAHKKGFDFSLDRDVFFKETQKDCALCGSHPTRACTGRKKSTIFYNGLDRKDNSKGYVEDNIQTLCWPCNKMKGNQNEAKFLDLIEAIYHKNIEKKKEKKLSKVFYAIAEFLEDYN